MEHVGPAVRCQAQLVPNALQCKLCLFVEKVFLLAIQCTPGMDPRHLILTKVELKRTKIKHKIKHLIGVLCCLETR